MGIIDVEPYLLVMITFSAVSWPSSLSTKSVLKCGVRVSGMYYALSRAHAHNISCISSFLQKPPRQCLSCDPTSLPCVEAAPSRTTCNS
jgi:hypothetical protein